MNKYRYSKVFKKNGTRFTIRVASTNLAKYIWHRIRGWYEYGRGNSYEYNDIERW